MRANSVGVAAAFLLLAGPALQGQRSGDHGPAVRTSTSEAVNGRFELTVDSIMRGPDLVGYPPTGLRWSADSQKLFFQWRKPGEKEASTYVVGRDGGEPRKLPDDEGKAAPPPNGRGGIVFVDRGKGSRRQITRTTGGESNPRWARHDTHVTYVRDGNLFIVPVDGSGDALVTQVADVAPKRAEPKLTDSQKFLRDEEERLIGFVRDQKEQKKKDDEKAKKN